MVTPFFHALWILTVLGAVVFTAASTRKSGSAQLWSMVTIAIGFAATAGLVSADRLPDPAWVGSVVALAAALHLFGPTAHQLGNLVSAFVGGALAGLCIWLLQILNIPVAAAVIFSVALPTMVVILCRRDSKFAPDATVEEALLGIMILGMAVAFAPGILAGWQSALSLNAGLSVGDKNSVSMLLPVWTLYQGGASVALGGLYSLWGRR